MSDSAHDVRRDAARELLRIPFCPVVPTAMQARFLLDLGPEVLYGGAAGGGKSIALLMGALQFVDVPGYAAIIFRRTLADLRQPSGLIRVAESWLHTSAARWSATDSTWVFPSGARLTFGYLDTSLDHHRYQGTEYQYIGFDELTQFREVAYRYLFSRLRRPAQTTGPLGEVPLRMRATANPGGAGHEWVKRRFIDPQPPGSCRRYIPARLTDNPHLDQASYEASLAELDPITRRQLLDGDWHVRPRGRLFQDDWFPLIDRTELPDGIIWVRYWDLAATEPAAGSDPDWTVGARVGLHRSSGTYYIDDVVRLRGRPHRVEALVAQTADRDGSRTGIWLEEEPGSSGKAWVDHIHRHVVPRFPVRTHRPTGDKYTRAQPVSSHAEAGHISLVRGPWNEQFLDELVLFPDGAHDDQVDALSGALAILAEEARRSMHGVRIPLLLKDENQYNRWRNRTDPRRPPAF